MINSELSTAVSKWVSNILHVSSMKLLKGMNEMNLIWLHLSFQTHNKLLIFTQTHIFPF